MDVKVVEKLLQEYTKHFKAESEGADSTDDIYDRLTSIISTIEEKFENLTNVNSDKKIFIRNLAKLITILVSSKYNTIKNFQIY